MGEYWSTIEFDAAATVYPSHLGWSGTFSINHLSKCFLNVSTVTPVISLNSFGIQLKSLSVCLAGLSNIRVFTLGSILRPPFPLYFSSPSCILLVPLLPLIFSLRKFSFIPSSCWYPYIITYLSLLLSMLYIFSSFNLWW